MGWPATLLPLILFTVRFLDDVMNYGRSRCMIDRNKFERPRFWETRNVNSSISSMKTQLFSLGIISTILLFVLKLKGFRPFSYPKATYLCSHTAKSSSIDPWGLDNCLPVPVAHDFHSDFISPAEHTLLLFAPFISFWMPVIQLAMDNPNVIEVDKFYCSGSAKIQMSISPGVPSWSKHCAPPIARGWHHTNQRSRRVLRSIPGASPLTTTRAPRRTWERRIHHRNSSARNSTLRPGGVVWHLSGGRGGEVGFGPSHRDFGHWIGGGIGGDQPLNVGRRVRDDETLNVEEGARTSIERSTGG
jgi:hypothetical protein